MKKKLLFLMSLIAAVAALNVAAHQSQLVYAANQYGIAKKITTLKAMRGVWYYQEEGNDQITTLKITKHSAAGYKLYVPSKKFFNKNVDSVSVKE